MSFLHTDETEMPKWPILNPPCGPVKGQFRKENENVSPDIDENDFLMLKLRLAQGFSLSEFETRFKTPFTDKYKSETEELIQRGLLQIQNQRVSCTDDGIMLLDYVLLKLFKS